MGQKLLASLLQRDVGPAPPDIVDRPRTAMTVDPGWYPYPNDPPGTFRRWNGSEWIGFPTTPPESEAELQDRAKTYTPRRRRFANQHRLLPYAVLAELGLLATIVTAIDVIRELRRALEATSGQTEQAVIDAPSLLDPLSHPSSQRFFVALLGGGLLFLIWLWRAHRNTGMALIRPRRSPLWAVVRFIFFTQWVILGWIFGPMLRAMGQLVEQSGDGPDRGKINPITPIIWRFLWAISTYFMINFWLFASLDTQTIRIIGIVMAGLLAMHAASLVLACWLVAVISVHQDRRLKG